MTKDIQLELPPTTNHTYFHKGHMVFKSHEARMWEQQALFDIARQKVPPLAEGKVYVVMDMFLKRDRDIDSSQKIVLDILAKAGIYTNDKLVEHLTIRKFIDKESPHIVVEVGNL